MNTKTTKDNLIEKTIKAYIKYFGLKIKNGFLYKKDIVIYTEDLKDENKLLMFLEGVACVYDNLELWGLE